MKEITHDLNHDLTFNCIQINCVCHSIRSMFRVLGIYNFSPCLIGSGLSRGIQCLFKLVWKTLNCVCWSRHKNHLYLLALQRYAAVLEFCENCSNGKSKLMSISEHILPVQKTIEQSFEKKNILQETVWNKRQLLVHNI